MEFIVSLFGKALTDSLEVAALVLAIAAIARIFRKILSPAWHYALWMLLLAKLLIPFVPGELDDRLSWISLPEAVESRLPSDEPQAVAIHDARAPSSKQTDNGVPVDGTIAAASRETGSSASPTVSIAAGIWLFGAVAIWIALLAAHYRMAGALRREPAFGVPGELAQAWSDIAENGGAARSRARIRVTELVSTPALIGFANPTVLIPRRLLGRLSESEWECILRHELAHLRRRDIPANLLACLLASVHWFNPLVWYGLNRIRSAQEAACDAYVLRSPELKETYAASMIKLLEIGVSRRLASAGVGFFGNKRQIKRRLVMIRDNRPVKKRASLAGIAILALTAVLTLPSAFASDKQDNEKTTQAATPPNTADKIGPAGPSTDRPLAEEAVGDEPIELKLVVPDASRMVSPYGYRVHPVTGEKTLHDGIDIAGPQGSAVTAAAAGTVVQAGYGKATGNTVTIQHGPAWKTEYRHLDKLSVQEGDKVQAGDEIGLLGSTGNSTGPHLHYSVMKNDEYVDPVPATKISLGGDTE